MRCDRQFDDEKKVKRLEQEDNLPTWACNACLRRVLDRGPIVNLPMRKHQNDGFRLTSLNVVTPATA